MGKKLKEKKGRNGKGKKENKTMERVNRTAFSRIDLTVTYCDSQASL